MSVDFIMRGDCGRVPESGGYMQNTFSVLSLRWLASLRSNRVDILEVAKFWLRQQGDMRDSKFILPRQSAIDSLQSVAAVSFGVGKLGCQNFWIVDILALRKYTTFLTLSAVSIIGRLIFLRI